MTYMIHHARNADLLSMILYKFKICMQKHIVSCKHKAEIKEVNFKCLEFESTWKKVKDGELHIDLPEILLPMTAPPINLVKDSSKWVAEDQGESPNGVKKRKNPNVNTTWKIRPKENYYQLFAKFTLNNCPKEDNKIICHECSMKCDHLHHINGDTHKKLDSFIQACRAGEFGESPDQAEKDFQQGGARK